MSVSRNSSSLALQSLTATYTDSEGEEEDRQRRNSLKAEDIQDLDSNEEKDTIVITRTTSPESNKSGTNTPQSGSSTTAAEIRRVAARLVSYNNEEAMSEDDNEEEDSNSRVEFPVIRASRPVSPEPEQLKIPGEELIPPEPPGKCAPELQEKITRLYEKMLREGMDMNAIIQQRKQFRNPSIYEKLIQFCDIDELGTNYPPEIYDPHRWGEESYYENLAKVQREEMEKREKERRERTKVEFVSGTASKKVTGTDDEKKRKSKWDQTGPNPTVLTAAATGTKTTVISAFGSLPKKSKLA